MIEPTLIDPALIDPALKHTARSIGAVAEGIRRRTATEPATKGRVVGSFTDGLYLHFGSETFAVGGPHLQPGPLHLVLNGPVPSLAEDQPVSISLDTLTLGDRAIGLGVAEVWSPQPPAGLNHTWPTLMKIAGLEVGHVEINPVEIGRSEIGDIDGADPRLAGPPTGSIPSELRPIWPEVVEAVLNGNLDAARTMLQGRGPGLTPVGDDVLAGVLLPHALARPGDPEPSRVAAAVDTTELSAAFLHWASRGQSIAPVHRMIDHAANAAIAKAQAEAEVVRGIGASSGAALILGIGLAARRALYTDP